MPVSSHSTETRQARQKGTIKLCGMSKAPRPSYLVYVSRVMPRSKAILSIGYLAAVRACRTRAANAARYCLGVTRRLLGVATAAPLRVLDIVYDPNPRWHTMLLRSLLASSSGTDVQAAALSWAMFDPTAGLRKRRSIFGCSQRGLTPSLSGKTQ